MKQSHITAFVAACVAEDRLTKDISKAEIEAIIAAEQAAAACEQTEAEEVEAVPEIEVIVPEIEVQLPEAVEVEACAESVDDGLPEGYNPETIIF